MRSKVIIFCTLFFCFKFVASTPFGEDSVRQKAYQPINWQANENAPGYYHGTDFARNHNSNSMTNAAQQYSTGLANRGQQLNNKYGFNDQSPLQSLPVRNHQDNFAPVKNERRSDSILLGNNAYTLRNQKQKVRGDNQPGHWQPHNRFDSSGSSAIANAAAPTAYDKLSKTVQEPYHSSDQHVQLPQANRQHYQAPSLYPGTRELHYHPEPEKAGLVRYVANSRSNPGTHPATQHYGNNNEAHSHITNRVKLGNNVYLENPPLHHSPTNSPISENYNHPSGISSDKLNRAETYTAQRKLSNNNAANMMYNNDRIVPINTVFNNGNNKNFMNNGPHIISGTNKHASNIYTIPSLPSNPVLDTSNGRYLKKTDIKSESDVQPLNINPGINFDSYNRAPVNNGDDFVLANTGLTNTANNDRVNLKRTNDNGVPFIPIDKTGDSAKAPKEMDSNPIYEPGNQDSYTLGQDNPIENIYHFSNGENVKEYFLNKIKKNFVIIHANGTVEYVDNLHTEDSPQHVVVKNDGKQPPLKQYPTKNLNRTDYFSSSVTQSPTDNEYYPSPVDTSSSAVLQPTTSYTHKPLPGGHHHNWPSGSNFEDKHSESPLSLHKHVSTTSPLTTTSSLNEDDEIIGQFFDSLANQENDDNQSPNDNRKDMHDSYTATTFSSDDGDVQTFLNSFYKEHDDNRPPNDDDHDSTISSDNNDYPYNHKRSTTPSPKSHTKISPGVFHSTTLTPDDSNVEQLFETLFDKTDTSLELTTNNNDQNSQILQSYLNDEDNSKTDSDNLSSDVPITPTDSTRLDQIITISPIELATDNVRDGSTPNPINEEILDKDNLDAKKYLSDLDEVKKSYDSLLTSDNPVVLENSDNADDILLHMTEGNSTDEIVITIKDIIKNIPKSDPINQNDANTDDTSTGDNLLESYPHTSGLKLIFNIPNDTDDTLYITADVPDSYTGNEDEETLYLTIQRQNSSNTDSLTVTNTTNHQDCNKTDHTNSDATTPNKNTMIDLTNALIVMNRTTDKDYLNQLLSSDAKVNMFIFQMPCQDQVLVERTKDTTIFGNGTCLEETTETTWKSTDDPTPTVVSTRKFYRCP